MLKELTKLMLFRVYEFQVWFWHLVRVMTRLRCTQLLVHPWRRNNVELLLEYTRLIYKKKVTPEFIELTSSTFESTSTT